MKKFTQLFLALSVMPILSWAQITITQSDLPTAGSKWIEFGDNRSGAHLITAGSASVQNWDYSTSFVVSDTSITVFGLASSTPAAYQAAFPNANLAIYSPTDSSATFVKTSSAGLFVDGAYDGTINANPKIIDYVGDLCLVPTPFTLNNTKNNTSRITIYFKQGTTNVKFILKMTQSFTADAFGSLKTPAGTFVNTLRMREMSYSSDSIFVEMIPNSGIYSPVSGTAPKDTSITYRWFQNGSDALLMTLDEDPFALGTSKGATYFDNNASVSVNQVKESVTTCSVSPNPVSHSNITFSMNSASADHLVIFNSMGQIVRTENVSNTTKLILSEDYFTNGIYFYNIYDHAGKQIYADKFSVLK